MGVALKFLANWSQNVRNIDTVGGFELDNGLVRVARGNWIGNNFKRKEENGKMITTVLHSSIKSFRRLEKNGATSKIWLKLSAIKRHIVGLDIW